MKIFRTLTVLIIALFAVQSISAQRRITREEYILKYKDLAMEKQISYGIPASITMAQGLLESDNGNSRLAIKANNHFGIKCRKEWRGETITHDDDQLGECFRKYNTVEESYRDHSEFLDKSARYQSLFTLDSRDYKGWARGLKAAGYATNPVYAEMLIKIIEDNQLHLLDEAAYQSAQESNSMQQTADVMAEKKTSSVIALTAETPEDEKIDIDNYVVAASVTNGMSVYINNGSEFVVAKEGDTYESIGKLVRIAANKLRRYNDVAKTAQPTRGTMVYIKLKSNRAYNGKLIHIAREGETLHSISQRYGIRLKNLSKMNKHKPSTPLYAGQQVRLV